MELTKDQIDACFEGTDGQAVVIERLYRIALPNWDDIVSVKGWPAVSETTNKYIFRAFIEFDQRHTKGCMPGGGWLNQGFAVKYDMPDWEVWEEYCEITLKEESDGKD
jgi:hypothetical protein